MAAPLEQDGYQPEESIWSHLENKSCKRNVSTWRYDYYKKQTLAIVRNVEYRVATSKRNIYGNERSLLSKRGGERIFQICWETLDIWRFQSFPEGSTKRTSRRAAWSYPLLNRPPRYLSFPRVSRVTLNKHRYPIIIFNAALPAFLLLLHRHFCTIAIFWSQFIRRPSQQTTRFRPGILHGLSIISRKVPPSFRFDMSVVHLHVNNLHKFDLGRKFLNLLLENEQLRRNRF